MSELQFIDNENPWPGLGSYGEAASPWFHGRDEETAALLRLIKRETLAVLYGRSGLGKTSLVQAGLFPRLRQTDYLPVRLHLVLADDAPSLGRQIGEAVAKECAAHGVEHRNYDEALTLWENFYGKDFEFWSADDRLITPVLVFDQFEEIFTLGRENPQRKAHCDELLTEIGDLVENRRPISLRHRIDAEPTLASSFDERRPSPKVLLSFREDYLPDFDVLYDYLRARTSNRLRLVPMTGNTAQAAIIAASPGRVSSEAAAKIVDFVAPGEKILAERNVEPALLSLVCRKLNERRQERKEDTIHADWLADGSAQSILVEFYEIAFAELDSLVRNFVEDYLLTASGHRDSCALDNAIEAPGVDAAAIQTLTDRRLLRREERGGQVRLELIHDVLAPIAKASRDQRRERERIKAQRKRQRVISAVVVSLTGIIVALSFLTWQTMEAKRRQERFTDLIQNLQPRLSRYSQQKDTPFLLKSALRFTLARFDEMLGEGEISTTHFVDARILETSEGFSVDGKQYSIGSWGADFRNKFLNEYPDLIELLLKTESIDTDEKQYWLDILPSMTAQQTIRLIAILATERGQLDELEEKYQNEFKTLNDKHTLEWFAKKSEKGHQKEAELSPQEAAKLIDIVIEQAITKAIDKKKAISILTKIHSELAKQAGTDPSAFKQLMRAHDNVIGWLDNPSEVKQKLLLSEKTLIVARTAHVNGLVSRWQLAGEMLSVSWYQLFLQRHEQAEQTCRENLRLQPNYLAAETNLAHALALQGKADEAQAIYRRNIGRTVILGDKHSLWEEEILNDITELRKAGLSSKIWDEMTTIMEGAVKHARDEEDKKAELALGKR